MIYFITDRANVQDPASVTDAWDFGETRNCRIRFMDHVIFNGSLKNPVIMTDISGLKNPDAASLLSWQVPVKFDGMEGENDLRICPCD
jgi:hypothetical protein